MSVSELPQRIDHDAPVFVISVAAHLAGMHPQTLRTYDRMGLVSPRRTAKRGRRYSARDIARLRLIQRLSQDEGINLEGIRRILHMQDEIDDLRARMQELTQLLAAVRAAPPGSRLFTADPLGGVHLAELAYGPRPRRCRGLVTDLAVPQPATGSGGPHVPSRGNARIGQDRCTSISDGRSRGRARRRVARSDSRSPAAAFRQTASNIGESD